jgi:hypothetical protein
MANGPSRVESSTKGARARGLPGRGFRRVFRRW